MIDEVKKSFDLDSYIYILGEKYQFRDIDPLLLPKKQEAIHVYYEIASKKLPQLVKETLNKTNLACKTIKLSNSRRIWGSFDRNGNMKLNWRLIILPERLINYVIIHELCHGVQLNHSPAFWSKVGEFCPEYKKLKKELEMFSFVLAY